MVLAFFSITAGFLGVPKALGGSNTFERFLEPVFATESVSAEAEHQLPVVGEHGEQAGARKAETAAAMPKHEGKEEKTEAIEYILMALSVALGFIGWGLAKYFYKKAEKGYVEPIDGVAPPAYALLLNKYYVDEIYDYASSAWRRSSSSSASGATRSRSGSRFGSRRTWPRCPAIPR